MIVIDASAFLELLLRTPDGLTVEEELGQERALAPHLFDAEVLHRLVAFGKHGVLTAAEVDSAVADLRDSPITRVDHRPLLDQARQLSTALSGYDALYAALAQALDARLVTTDRAFAATASLQLGLEVAHVP